MTLSLNNEDLTQLRADVTSLRAAFMRNREVLMTALRASRLPDSWLGGWQEKLDRMNDVLQRVGRNQL